MNRGMISVARVYFGDNPKLHEKKRIAVNGVLVERKGRRIHLLGREWPIETANMVAAALLELAEAAKAEPDPETLAAVTETIEEHLRLCEDSEDVARAILTGFKVEKRRQPTVVREPHCPRCHGEEDGPCEAAAGGHGAFNCPGCIAQEDL